MTNTLTNEAPPPDVRRAQRKSRSWGVVAVIGLLVVGAGLIYLVVASGQQNSRISTLSGVIDKQNDLYGQVCRLAGGQVNNDPAAREACARVERGEPAVPIPVVVTGVPGQKGEAGVGVLNTRQIDHCFIEVTLTNGVSTRFGPFCGADGAIGPTGVSGPPGPTGESGSPGRRGLDGLGIATVRTASNPCLVDVVLTDDSTRTVGPFCGPPLGEFTMTDENGVAKRCVRDGGSDTAPNYACRSEQSTTSSATTTASPTPGLIPTP